MSATETASGRGARPLWAFDGLLQRFDRCRVLVLGDMVADEYVVGRPARISREAPVLILQYANSFVRPGGATNTAYNLCRLGARTAVVGVIGDDEMGHRLRQALEDECISTTGLIVDPHRPTTTATRVLAGGTQQQVQQQIVRIDRVDTSVLDGPLRDRTVDALRTMLPDMDALLISDYENGVISQEVLDACLPAARERNLTVTVDSHGDLFRFKGVTAATPNQPEAESILHRGLDGDQDLDAAGHTLLQGMDAQAVLITRGSQGVALYERNAAPYKIPVAVTNDSEIVDPTGAGDTVAAVFTLAIASGASMREAAFLGNLAGGEVVRKLGAATLTRDELSVAAAGCRLHPPV